MRITRIGRAFHRLLDTTQGRLASDWVVTSALVVLEAGFGEEARQEVSSRRRAESEAEREDRQVLLLGGVAD